ncbi:MAG: 3'-5' exonuclease, partial [Acidimicrobiales bacterium]
DPRQAVYAWNGSDPSLLVRLPELLPGTVVTHLDENHRSSPQIVSAARAVLGLGADDDGPRAVLGLVEGPAPIVTGFDDDAEEAVEVARWLRLAHRPGRPWSHLAVLARTNARLTPIAEALQRARIPYRLASRRAFPNGIDRILQALRAVAPGLPLRSALGDALGDALAEGSPRSPGYDETVALLARLCDEHALEEPGPTVGGFLAWLAATAGSTGLESTGLESTGHDGVELATFHRAKGLEWTAVAIVGLVNGSVPIAYATSAPARAEERRLLYVALTRAESELWCSWARRRTVGARSWACEPSPMLDAVRDAAATGTVRTDAENASGLIAGLRSRLPAAG